MPLQNHAAERLVIGKLLGNPAMFWEYNGRLEGAHFSKKIHESVYNAIYGLNMEGKQPTLRLLQSRVGVEYDNGNSTIMLLTALIREAEDVESIDDQVEGVVDLWKRRATLELIEQFRKETTKPETDTNYMLTDLENCVKDITARGQTRVARSMKEIATEVVQNSTKAQQGEAKVMSIDPGLPSLRDVMGTIHAGDLGYVLAAQGDGKTVAGMQFLRAAAERGFVGNMHQLEMKDHDVASRVLADASGIGISQIEEGDYDFFEAERLKEALAEISHLPIYIDDEALLPIEEIRNRSIVLKTTKSLSILVIDHMRLVQTMRKNMNKFDRVEYVSSHLKKLAKDLKIAVIGLSQVTRASQRRDDPVPRISDSDLGSAVEQDADWAISLFRRDRFLQSQEPWNRESEDHRLWADEIRQHIGRIEVRGLKRRRGKPGEMRVLGFDGPRYRIYELGDR